MLGTRRHSHTWDLLKFDKNSTRKEGVEFKVRIRFKTFVGNPLSQMGTIKLIKCHSNLCVDTSTFILVSSGVQILLIRFLFCLSPPSFLFKSGSEVHYSILIWNSSDLEVLWIQRKLCQRRVFSILKSETRRKYEFHRQTNKSPNTSARWYYIYISVILQTP
jgi:hypothetical protein